MSIIEEEVENIRRFDEILKVLSEQGFGFILDELDLNHRLPLYSRFKPDRNKIPPPERLRETFEELGPTFIKFGQILSQRPDIVPREYIKELEKLQDQVPPFKGEKARQIIEEEVGMENIQDFNAEPVAAASIAQVHEARLNNGDKVALKIRRPGIEKQIRQDLEILEFLGGRAERINKLEKIKLQKSIKAFSRWTKQELNLKREGRNAEILRGNLADEDRIKIPEVYQEFTTEKVLVMEYVDGVRSSNLEALEKLDIEREELAETAIRAGLKQIIRDGFFHGDPHPSNFLVSDEGELVYIDFGMMGRLTKDTRKNLGLMIIHALDEDVEGTLEVFKNIGHITEDADIEGLKAEIEDKILLIKNSTIEEHSLTSELLDITIKATQKGIVMPPSLVLMGKSLLTMEGIGLRVYPEYQINEEFNDNVQKMLKDQYSTDDMLSELKLDLIENSDLITELPSKLNKLTERNDREVKVVKESSSSSQSIIAAALIVSSTLILAQTLQQEYLVYLAGIQIFIAWTLYLRR